MGKISGLPPPQPPERGPIQERGKEEGFTQPFPTMKLTKKQAEGFWKLLLKDFSRQINHELQRIKQALKKIRQED